MNYDFIAIDFETANEKRLSACCMALIFFKNGKIIDEKEWIIKPHASCNYFNDLNIQIHGITPDKVENAPEFMDVWNDIYPLITNEILVAHNAPFDISVLRNLIETYDLNCPNLKFICTCNVSRKTWDNHLNYTLKNIANNLGYIFNHHDAHDDAKICGRILLEAFKIHQVSTVEELANKINMRIGSLSAHDYVTCSITKAYKGLGVRNGDVKVREIVSTNDSFDVTHPLFDKKVIFTGALISMTRQTAMQKVVDLGGHIGKSLAKDTNLLVMGLQDYTKFVDGKESTKTKRAKQYISEGYNLEIIDEDSFIKML